ncbi:hypothetical protein [Streptomyces sp. NPDC001404]|uniref:hypothetical protein n=1 Tax=Streptomyces sp. NPDC001404 TaxID=3364571 RepID=UPI0036C5F2A9
MARIQVLQLPDSIDEIAPFAIIIDQAADLVAATERTGQDPLPAFKAACGARAVLLTEATIEVRH